MRFFLLGILTLLMAAAGIRATLGLDAILKPRLYYLRYILFNSTLWIKRIEHRKWNRRRNGLHQLGQPVAPSILFPVFNPPYPQGRPPWTVQRASDD